MYPPESRLEIVLVLELNLGPATTPKVIAKHAQMGESHGEDIAQGSPS